jgi:hypothetical protein
MALGTSAVNIKTWASRTGRTLVAFDRCGAPATPPGQEVMSKATFWLGALFSDILISISTPLWS